jgi:hypothetical protein
MNKPNLFKFGKTNLLFGFSLSIISIWGFRYKVFILFYVVFIYSIYSHLKDNVVNIHQEILDDENPYRWRHSHKKDFVLSSSTTVLLNLSLITQPLNHNEKAPQ